jgi:hypothetical protein
MREILDLDSVYRHEGGVSDGPSRRNKGEPQPEFTGLNRGGSPPTRKPKPNDLTEDGLRQAISKYWQIDEIRPVFLHVGAAIRQLPGMPVPSPLNVDEQGRQNIPAFLLTAHKAR